MRRIIAALLLSAFITVSSGSGVLNALVGAGQFSPITQTYTSGSGSQTVPIGAVNVVIEVWGGGAPGGAGNIASGNLGGGGGASGYARSSYAVLAGQTIDYSVGIANNASTASSGTLSITTMQANPGAQGSAATTGGPGTGGAGGSATGGNQANTTGGAGNTGDGGGTAPAGVNANNPATYGNGGAGSPNSTINPGTGGIIAFHFT
jgi:hypothetical protein